MFEVPTGVVADTRGRRFSFLLGTATLLGATLLYLVMWQMKAAARSAGRSPRSCSGSASRSSPARPRRGSSTRSPPPASRHARADLRPRPDRDGRAMLGGSVARRLRRPGHEPRRAVPPARGAARRDVRVAFVFMHDIGFTPTEARASSADINAVIHGSIDGGLRNPPVRWLMLAAPFTAGVGIFAFYAMQPYLLQLYGDPTAYGDRRARGGDRRRRADRRRADREPRAAVLPPAHRRPPPGRGRHGRPARADRPDRPVRPRAGCCSSSGR